MRIKKVTRMLALLLAMVMMFTACGGKQTSETGSKASESQAKGSQDVSDASESASSASEYPEYLNLDSAYPIIKDEYADDITLTLAIIVDDSSKEWDELWIGQYLKGKYNLNFEVELIRSTASSERRTLLLNSGEIPDLIWNFNFSTTEILKYGQDEGLFLKMDEYMNETLTPNILKYLQGDVKNSCTTPDGHVYTLPYLTTGALDGGNYVRFFVDKAVLDELEIAMPTTLDEFIDAMYAVKAAYPDMYPFGGGMSDSLYTSNTKYLLEALGYVTNSIWGYEPCLRDGEVVIPVYDMDVYKEFLKILKQFYDDGIVVPNFFTIEDTEVNAMVTEGKTIIYANAPFVTGIDDWSEWTTLYALTSDWQEEPEVPTPTGCTIGGFVISADTEYPELCLRIADAFYNNEDDICGYMWGGTVIGTEDYEKWGYGISCTAWSDEANYWVNPEGSMPEGYNAWQYNLEYVNGAMPAFGAYSLGESTEHKIKEAIGVDWTWPVRNIEISGDHQFRWTIENDLIQYAAPTYPSIYYCEPETAERINELQSVMLPYVEEQVALFITGRRSLDETDAFVEELEGMGMDELLQIYTDIYDTYIGN